MYSLTPNPVVTLTLLQVIMTTKEGAETACKEPNPIIDGRRANVNLAILGAKPRAGGQLISGIIQWTIEANVNLAILGAKPRAGRQLISGLIVDHRGQCQPRHPRGQAQGWWSAYIRYNRGP
jgi:hypothetical protein